MLQLCLLLLVITAHITAMPVTTSAPEAIASLALSSCFGGTVESSVPSSQLVGVLSDNRVVSGERESVLRTNFQNEMAKLEVKANSLLTMYTSWTSILDTRTRKSLTQSVASIINVDTTQGVPTSTTTSRLQTLTQLSVYAYYLTSQDSIKDYGSGGVSAILDLSNTLSRAVCTLKQLVQPAVSNDQLREFILQSYTKSTPALNNKKPLIKRAVTSTVVSLMLQSLGSLRSNI